MELLTFWSQSGKVSCWGMTKLSFGSRGVLFPQSQSAVGVSI